MEDWTWLVPALVVATVWFTVLGAVRLLATRQVGAREASAQRRLGVLALALAATSVVALTILIVLAAVTGR